MRNTKNILPLLILLSLFFVSCDFHVYGLQDIKGVRLPEHVVMDTPFYIELVGTRTLSSQVTEKYYLEYKSSHDYENNTITSESNTFADVVLHFPDTYYCKVYTIDDDKRHKINEFSYNFIVEVHEE